jgi:penicillin-binding protein 1A
VRFSPRKAIASAITTIGLDRFVQRHPRGVRRALIACTGACGFFVGVAVASWTLVCRNARCPSIDALELYTPNQTSKLYAIDGRLITEIGSERRTLISLAEIPKTLQDAFVITEDKRFYRHAGIDWWRVFGAAIHDVFALRFAQGFSTITMQLARNVFPEDLSRDKSPVRKLKEAQVALAIEKRYSKEKILELYLNQISLGSGAYGVETAAQRYFGKSARDVSLAEAATLAALPKAPSIYNPRLNPDKAIGRRNLIIGLMQRAGVVSASEASIAKASLPQLARRTEAGEAAPYYVEWLRQQLEERFGRQLYAQGLKVYTTLDLEMQSAAERALERQLRWVEAGNAGPFRHTTYEQYLAKNASGDRGQGANSPYLQGAFIAIDPQTGAVRALIGGRDFDDSKFNRATQALRQAGSTFKPFVYSDAIRNGRPASYLINDDSLEVPQIVGETWIPKNYDLKYEGPMTMREGLYRSRNIIAIRVGMELGEASVIETARRFGITSDIKPYPSTFIGSADVYPIEMVSAYGTFATLGFRAPPMGILRVENQRGQVLWQPAPERLPVLTTEEAWLMVDMMKDVIRRPGGSANGSVYERGGFHRPAGGKTGTTNDGNDVWFIGYTADLVAGVWMGFDFPQKIKDNAQGGILAAPAWANFMNEVYSRRPDPPDWPRPEGIVMRQVDGTTGMLSNRYCPADAVYPEFYIPGTEPILQCTVHTSRSPRPADSVTASTRPPIPPPS